MLFNRLKAFFVFIILFLSVCILLVLKSRSEEPKTPIILAPQPTVEITEYTLGDIIIIIDDFGYRNDEVSEGFLTLNADLTFAVIPGHENSKLFAKNKSWLPPTLYNFKYLKWNRQRQNNKSEQ